MTYDTTWRRRFDVQIFHLIDMKLPDGTRMGAKEVAMAIGISKWVVYRALHRGVKNSRKKRQRERWTRRRMPIKI